jgi:GNAT superfamily N-acetyltransferase
MVTLTVGTSVGEEVRDLVGSGLDEYNAGHAGPHNLEDLWIVARDDAGAVQAGLKGKSEYSWLFVDWLWVSPPHRNRGIGARLLGKAEEIARGRGCIGVHLGSLTFQAPDFYRRQGYEEVGRVEDFPPGHALVLFKKLL